MLKRCVFLIFVILVLPLFCGFWILSKLGRRNQVFAAFSQFLSLFPGIVGSYLRAAFYRLAMDHCDQDLIIGFGTLFSQSNTELYSGVYIGPQCNIGACKLEQDCLLGSGVHIMSGKGQHNFEDLHTPLRMQGGSYNQIVVGQDSWIGNGALVMANIGKKCIIGAGSVVISDIPDFAIAAGNPAKIIKYRQ